MTYMDLFLYYKTCVTLSRQVMAGDGVLVSGGFVDAKVCGPRIKTDLQQFRTFTYAIA